MLHFVWWFFFGYLGFGWGTPRWMWMGCDSLCSHCSAWLGKWMVPCFADFMGAVRCLLLKKLRMSRNDRVPMLPGISGGKSCELSMKKAHKKTGNSAGFDVTCRFAGHSPCWVLGFAHGFSNWTSNDFFGGRPPNPAALLVRQEDFFAQQWFSLWRRQAG